MRVGTLVLFLILEDVLSVFPHLILCRLLFCCIWPLLFWGIFHLILMFLGLLSWRHVELCQEPFLLSIEILMRFLCLGLFMWCFTFIDLCVFNQFCISGMSLLHNHVWSLNVFLNLVCRCFVEQFCIYIHRGNWAVVIFFVVYLINTGLIEWIVLFLFLFFFQEIY